MKRQDVLRWLAPVAFLAGLTIAVLLIRAGLNHDATTTAPTVAVPTVTTPTVVTTAPATTARTLAQFVRVQAGDTYGAIAARAGTTVQELERLNPGVSSNALVVGQKIRVK